MGHRRSDSSRWRASVAVAIAAAGMLLSTSVGALSQTWSTNADFNAGVLTGTVAIGNEVRLDTTGVGAPDSSIPWWNPAWGQRRCIDVTNNEAASLTEFQVVLRVDTATPIAGGRMDPAGDDLRFIAADGSTELDYWIEGPINDTDTQIWVQTETLPPGVSTICMYYDNAAAAAQSDVYAPFTYVAPRPLYVAVSETQVNRAIGVTSYVANNQISDGINSTTIGAGGTHTFAGAGHTAATVVSATGPLALQGIGSASDTYVPLAFAGTDFVIASARSSNRLSIYAPFAAAAVTVQHSGTTTNVAVPAGTSVSINADVTSTADSAVVTSTEPVLVTHIASNNDALVAVPASDEPIYGIRSTQHITGFGADDTAVSIDESDGTHLFIAGTAASAVARAGGGSQGTGPAVLVTPAVGGSISGTQQADSDGGESTSYWPRSEMNVVYRTPVDAQYVAFACPEQALANLESDGANLNCTGTGGAPFPGKARDAGGLVAGDLFRSLDGVPFHMYMEDFSNDENNVLGPKQARLTTTNPPTTAIGPEESPFLPSGTWTSPVRDVGCAALFEDLAWNPLAQPGSTAVRFQVASAAAAAGPFDYLGPDGTNATFYTAAAGTPIATVHDGDQYFRVRASLTSTDAARTPRVADATVTFDGSVTVNGRLFGDMNGDGSGAGDPGLAGIDVTLWLDDGDGTFDPGTDTPVATTTSAGAGNFTFVGQRPDTYFVRADETQLPAGYVTPGTTPNPVGPLVGSDCSTLSAEIGWQQRSSVAVTVFSDRDSNGSFDGSDVTLPGVDIELWRDDGDGQFDPGTDTRTSIVTSDSMGIALFTDLAIGDYFARVPNSTTPDGHATPATTANPVGPLSIVDDMSVATSIGFAPSAAISGVVVFDADGTVDSTSVPIFAAAVRIYLDDGDGRLDRSLDTEIATVVTNEAGEFVFEDLSPGQYFVELLGPSSLLTSQLTVIGDNPIGPVPAATTGLVFALDPTSIQLPATGSDATQRLTAIGAGALALGVGLLLLGRRRTPTRRSART